MRRGLAIVLGLATGCADVRATIDEVCLTRTEIAVEPGSWNIAESFDVGEIPELEDLRDLDGEVHFVRARLTATTGVDDFDWLESAEMHVASGDPDSTLPTMRLLHCVGDDCPRDGRLIELPAESERDALDYVESGSLAVDLYVGGAPPEREWVTDIDVCLGGSFHLPLAL